MRQNDKTNKKPKYLSPRDIAFDLSIDLSTARALIDECGAAGGQVVQRERLLRVLSSDFWNWWEQFSVNSAMKDGINEKTKNMPLR